jgi:hypothetical protein
MLIAVMKSACTANVPSCAVDKTMSSTPRVIVILLLQTMSGRRDIWRTLLYKSQNILAWLRCKVFEQ